MANGAKAKILTPEQVEKLRYPLPKSLIRAAGLLRDKPVDPVKWQRQIRNEWETRLKKLHRRMSKTKKK